MKTEATANRRLADITLGRPLDEYVAEKRTARPRWSWRLIAQQLSEDTDGDIQLSHQTLRLWFGENAERAA